MKLLRNVNFSEVLTKFDTENQNSSTYDWARKLLKSVNTYQNEKWSLVQLSYGDARFKITLMNHQHGDKGYGTGIILVSKSGGSVIQARKNLLNSWNEYTQENKKCLATIKYLKGSRFSPIFLSSKLPSGIEILGHKLTQLPEGNYYHLDGLHRVVAWELSGKFHPIRYYFGRKLTAYVAGKIN